MAVVLTHRVRIPLTPLSRNIYPLKRPHPADSGGACRQASSSFRQAGITSWDAPRDRKFHFDTIQSLYANVLLHGFTGIGVAVCWRLL